MFLFHICFQIIFVFMPVRWCQSWKHIMKVIHRLFFEKEPLRVEFHCCYNFWVESVKEDLNAFCFHVVDAIGLIWSFWYIVRVENTSRQQFRVKFQVSNNKSSIKLFKRSIKNDRDCMMQHNVKKRQRPQSNWLFSWFYPPQFSWVCCW